MQSILYAIRTCLGLESEPLGRNVSVLSLTVVFVAPTLFRPEVMDPVPDHAQGRPRPAPDEAAAPDQSWSSLESDDQDHGRSSSRERFAENAVPVPSQKKSNLGHKYRKRSFRLSAPTTTWKKDFYEARYHEKTLRKLLAFSLTGQINYRRYFFNRQIRHGRPFLPGDRQFPDQHYLDLAFEREHPAQLSRQIPGLELQNEIRLRASDMAYLLADQKNRSVDQFLSIFDYGALLALGMVLREHAKALIRPVLHDSFYKPIRCVRSAIPR